MLVDLLPLLIAVALGLRLQTWSRGEQTRSVLWQGYYLLMLPAAATYAFLALDLDRALLAAIGSSLAAWWCVVGASYGWARIAAASRPQRAAFTLIGAFPNTGFLGYPLAQLAYGREGLRLAVVYDQVSLIVPSIVVATVIARTHMGGSTDDGAMSTAAITRRQLLLSPPLWAVLILIALRLTLVREPVELNLLGDIVGHSVGPVGFLLLGLSIPLHGFSHDRREVVGVTGATIVRLALAPLLVWGFACATDTDVPAPLYLVSAMPTAFLSLVIARQHGLEVATVRLGIVVTTVIGVTGIIGWIALR